MTMTKDEIVRDYKAAKTPAKQIAVLADLNVCTKKEIVEILREAGCELPAYYTKKKQEKPEAVGLVYAGSAGATGGIGKHEEPALTPDLEKVLHETAEIPYRPKDVEYIAPDMNIRFAAIEAIANLLARTKDAVDFMEQVRGVLALVWAMEQKEDA